MEGKTFTREIVSEGHFGQPKGIRSHTVSFNNGLMCDDADTFFGSPPTIQPYEVIGGVIMVDDKPEYTIIDNKTIGTDNGVILKLKK
jgi:hypothetical protein